MNILLVTEAFYPDGVGGINTYVYELGRNLVKKNHNVFVITPRFNDNLPREEEIEEMKVFRYNSTSSGPLLFIRRPFLSILNARFLFKKLSKNISFDVINFHSSLPAFGINIFSFKKILKIYTFHASMYQEVIIQSRQKRYTILSPISLILFIIKYIEKINLRHSDKIIVLSEFNKKQLLKLYKRIDMSKIKIIPGGVNVEDFKPTNDRIKIRKQLNLSNNKFLLLTVRRLVARMGLENLIYVIKKLKKQIPEILLIIGGEGFLKDKLINLIKRENLDKNIILKGHLKDSELKLYYQACDLFVLPTEQLEGFGLVTLEALSSGLPVIGTPIGGTPEILKSLDPSLLFEDSSSKAIADGLIKLINSPDKLKAIRQKCRNYVVNNFSWNEISSKIEQTFKEIL